MPYCQNGSLSRFLFKVYKKTEKLPIDFILYICKQMILAVHSLHTLSNMAHLDLKQDNYVITDCFRIVLIDFGQSESISAMLNHPTGTRLFQAPEITRIIEDKVAL